MIRFFQHLVIEADFRQAFIGGAEGIVILRYAVSPCALQDIPDFHAEYATVPQCALFQQGLSLFLVRLLRKAPDFEPAVLPRSRQDIAVFAGRVGGSRAHQPHLRAGFPHNGFQLLHSLKIAALGVGIHRHNRRIIFPRRSVFQKPGAGEQYSGKGIPAPRLHRDLRLFHLTFDQLHLLPACRDDSLSGDSGFVQLLPDSLEHRAVFHGIILFIDHLQVLLGPRVVGQGPEPFSGASGQ